MMLTMRDSVGERTRGKRGGIFWLGSSGCGYSEWWATNGAIVRENGVIFEWRRGTGTEGIEEWRTSGEAVGWKWGGFWDESQWELGDRCLIGGK